MARVASDAPERRISGQQALNAGHDERSPLGAVRVVSRSVLDLKDGSGVVFDWDPFDWDPFAS
jgi:hypothetical protein